MPEQTQKLIENNHIKKFQAKNFRLFKQIDVEFNEKFNFIVGPNASGKTSILRAMAHCLTYNDAVDTRYKLDTSFYTDYLYDNKSYRVGSGSNFMDKLNQYQKKIDISRYNKPERTNIEDTTILNINDINSYASFITPLFIGAYRKINYQLIQGMKREENIVVSRQHYRDNSVNYLYSTSTPDVKQWMINRYFIIEKDWAIEEEPNWNWLIKKLPCLASTNSNFQLYNIQKDLEPTFKLYDN